MTWQQQEQAVKKLLHTAACHSRKKYPAEVMFVIAHSRQQRRCVAAGGKIIFKT